MHPGETPRSQFAGTSWTARTGAVLFLVFVAATVAVLGSYFGPIGWLVALAIVVVAGVAILRDRSTS
jgi:energy-coupling factor transporter transmembrane protein EcfT